MSNKIPIPDYELVDEIVVTEHAQLRAMGNPIRSDILELLLERAATVTELAEALERPKSTVAHHVSVLVDAGLIHAVRIQRVRAIDERYYGRTARLIRVGVVDRSRSGSPSVGPNPLSEAAVEASQAHIADALRSTTRHVRIPAEVADGFWERVVELAQDFSKLPRSGDDVHGFVAAIYRADRGKLPQ
jgi:DNA-binding transcriptional ArsR family regulator